MSIKDIITVPDETLKKISEPLEKVSTNEKKLINCVNSTNLQNLKKIENKKGFLEKPFTSKKFFRKGVVDEWTNVLNNEQIKLIENNFFQEMKTLEYL